MVLAAGFVLLAAPGAQAEPCQNQLDIDACLALCTATSDACSGLCGAAIDVCTGLCIGGCAVTCADDCCFGFCPGSDDCVDCIDDCEDDCASGCQLECDNCILDCEAGCPDCIPFRQVGESCIPVINRCADGLTCWPFPLPGDSTPRCFPNEDDTLYPDETCRAFYSSDLHQAAIDAGVAMSYGTGSSAAGVVGGTVELGVVYGPDGRYGCYVTSCVGATSDAEISTYASIGLYNTYDDFSGQSIAIVEEAGDILAFVTGQILNLSGDLIGTIDCLSFELSLLPIAVGVYDCSTIVDTVGMRAPDGSLIPITNSPPIALCSDVMTCADDVTCDAEADIDMGSTDPDGDSITVSQSPAGPYGIGEHTVTLTATDPDGETDTCTSTVTIQDCTPPVITCPGPTVVECESNGQTVVDPGDAVATDCSEVMVTDPGASSYPLGQTTVTYTATDAAGNESSCDTTVTVQDTLDPVITGVTPTPDVLWPANHKMVDVVVDIAATDICDPELTCEIIDVLSSEPAVGGVPDIEMVDATLLRLRAERSGNGPGRTYTITVECTDDSGNSVQSQTAVFVPHDQRRRR